MREQIEIHDKYIALAIALKTNELKRTELSSLTYELVESALLAKWNLKKPNTMEQAIDDIVHLNANEAVAYLSTNAMIAGSKMKIDEFDDLLRCKEK